MILRKIKIPIHGLGKQMVDRSAFIYLSEPFISFVILNLYIWPDEMLLLINDIMFYIYQATRIVVLLAIVSARIHGLGLSK